jgi:hypothetical protein
VNRKFLIGSAVACVCLGATASAGAATIPVPLSFNHVVLDTPSTHNAQIVTPSTQPLTVTAEVDTMTGDFTVQPSGFSMPSYSFSSPVPGTVTVALKQPATGNVNFVTGAVTMNADLLANIAIESYGSCQKDTGPLTLSTSTTQPLPGQNFPAGTTGVASGPGAFGAGWSSLAPGTGQACSVVDPAVQGKGGFWVSRDISPVPPAVAAAAKAPKRTKPGKTAKVTVTVRDTGGADANPIKACLTDPRPLSPKTSCQTVKSLAQGASKTLTFKVRTNKKKKGRYALKLRVTGKGISSVSKKVTLVVR